MSDKSDKTKIDLGILEEDDEFEEFPAEDWTSKDLDVVDISVWEDNWDDDNIEDDFCRQLQKQVDIKQAENDNKSDEIQPENMEQPVQETQPPQFVAPQQQQCLIEPQQPEN